jgi:hypothetical protein
MRDQTRRRRTLGRGIAEAGWTAEIQDADKRDAAIGARLQEDPIKQGQRRWSADPAAASSAVHQLNAQLRAIVKWLPRDDARSYSFFCECGCYEPGELTAAEYDALEGKPIYLDGHAPPE